MMAAVAGAVLLAGGAGSLAWIGAGMPIRMRASAKQSVVEGTWDLGPTLPRTTLLALRIASGAVMAIIVMLSTHNVGVSLIFGSMSGMLPTMVLRRMTAARRAKLDTQAYTLANSLRLLLPISDNVVAALGDAVNNAEEPLKSILSQSLRDEMRMTGSGTEMLRKVGRDLGLADMELLGDILVQIRTQTTRASDLLIDLVAMWGARLQTEQKRLGKISGSTRLGIGMILISVLIQVGWPAFSLPAREADGRLIGQVVGSLGAAMTAGAWMMLDRATRRAMNAVR